MSPSDDILMQLMLFLATVHFLWTIFVSKKNSKEDSGWLAVIACMTVAIFLKMG